MRQSRYVDYRGRAAAKRDCDVQAYVLLIIILLLMHIWIDLFECYPKQSEFFKKTKNCPREKSLKFTVVSTRRLGKGRLPKLVKRAEKVNLTLAFFMSTCSLRSYLPFGTYIVRTQLRVEREPIDRELHTGGGSPAGAYVRYFRH
jgi:hypothetical protein